MKPQELLVRGWTGFGLRLLQAAALAWVLVLNPGTSQAAPAAPAPAAATTHVYLLRGVLNIFSLGLDTLADKLRARGIPVTVANFASWSSLADEAIAAHRAGKLKTIILVGHSSGATALPDMVAKFDRWGVPVKLAIGLDSVFKTKLSGNVERYINFYIASGAGEPVARNPDFRGKLENVDVQGVPGIGHISIDKNEQMHARVISAIETAVRSNRSVAGARAPQSAQPAQGSTPRSSMASTRN